jgi:hypothetical protein
VSVLKHCEHCGYTGPPDRQGIGLLWLAAFMWLVPIAFVSFGFWPFFLVPAVAVTAWAYISYRLVCPACGKSWRSKSGPG